MQQSVKLKTSKTYGQQQTNYPITDLLDCICQVLDDHPAWRVLHVSRTALSSGTNHGGEMSLKHFINNRQYTISRRAENGGCGSEILLVNAVELGVKLYSFAAHLNLHFPTERNGMQPTERNQTKGKFSFRSARLEVTVGRFPQNCSYPFRPRMDFQAERSKTLTIHFIPSEKA
uniref:Uncharacterized protein n=1 Tax=Romanomermis culicivorax TaxID=13658 RepID=A0A915HXR1_ROMCU